jgi:hypothetical protein
VAAPGRDDNPRLGATAADSRASPSPFSDLGRMTSSQVLGNIKSSCRFGVVGHVLDAPCSSHRMHSSGSCSAWRQTCPGVRSGTAEMATAWTAPTATTPISRTTAPTGHRRRLTREASGPLKDEENGRFRPCGRLVFLIVRIATGWMAAAVLTTLAVATLVGCSSGGMSSAGTSGAGSEGGRPNRDQQFRPGFGPGSDTGHARRQCHVHRLVDAGSSGPKRPGHGLVRRRVPRR